MKAVFVSLLACLCLGLAVGQAGAEKPWLDPPNCDMCKGMVAEPGLMEHMSWENYAVSNGMLSLCTVDPAYAKAYEKAMMHMEETKKKLMAGEKLNLCGCCTSIGELAMAGAVMNEVATKGGHAMIMTSSDEALIKKIHAHVEKTNEAFAKMMEAEGHDHTGQK